MVSTRLRWRVFRPWIENPCSRVFRKLSGELTTIQYCAVRPPPDFRFRRERPDLAGRSCSAAAASEVAGVSGLSVTDGRLLAVRARGVDRAEVLRPGGPAAGGGDTADLTRFAGGDPASFLRPGPCPPAPARRRAAPPPPAPT